MPVMIFGVSIKGCPWQPEDLQGSEPSERGTKWVEHTFHLKFNVLVTGSKRGVESLKMRNLVV